jgi:hypothetical protein
MARFENNENNNLEVVDACWTLFTGPCAGDPPHTPQRRAEADASECALGPHPP